MDFGALRRTIGAMHKYKIRYGMNEEPVDSYSLINEK